MKRLSVDLPTGKEKNIKINKQIRRIIFLNTNLFFFLVFYGKSFDK
jgi:hypothetical protein